MGCKKSKPQVVTEYNYLTKRNEQILKNEKNKIPDDLSD